jgi:hypothetical protein
LEFKDPKTGVIYYCLEEEWHKDCRTVRDVQKTDPAYQQLRLDREKKLGIDRTADDWIAEENCACIFGKDCSLLGSYIHVQDPEYKGEWAGI